MYSQYGWKTVMPKIYIHFTIVRISASMSNRSKNRKREVVDKTSYANYCRLILTNPPGPHVPAGKTH